MEARRTETIKKEIETQFSKLKGVFRSKRLWKERAISELLGPMYVQFDRTQRASDRWNEKNLFLEAKVIGEGNQAVRDLLLKNAHLIPPPLLDDAAALIEHYDRWLEEYDKLRLSENPDLDTPFVFAGRHGYPFPAESQKRFREAYKALWEELYGDIHFQS